MSSPGSPYALRLASLLMIFVVAIYTSQMTPPSGSKSDRFDAPVVLPSLEPSTLPNKTRRGGSYECFANPIRCFGTLSTSAPSCARRGVGYNQGAFAHLSNDGIIHWETLLSTYQPSKTCTTLKCEHMLSECCVFKMLRGTAFSYFFD